MDHITAMKVMISYLESAQKKGHFTIEDAAKIFNAQVVMNNYIMSNQNKSKEQDNTGKNENQVDNEVLNQLKTQTDEMQRVDSRGGDLVAQIDTLRREISEEKRKQNMNVIIAALVGVVGWFF